MNNIETRPINDDINALKDMLNYYKDELYKLTGIPVRYLNQK